MKRKLIYLAGLLVILAGVLGPAFYMHKVFSSEQQYGKARGSYTAGSQPVGQSEAEKENTAVKPESAPGKGQSSPAAVAASQTSSTGAKQDSHQKEQPNGTSRKGTVPAQAAGNTAAALESEGGCRVWVAVVGKNGEFLFRPAQVTVKADNKWGVTAMGALDATGLSYTMKPTWPDFVDSIGGQANSAMAGWMYAVNGEVPMHMASKHPVKNGDKVVWWYSRSMDQPPPRWEDLVNKK